MEILTIGSLSHGNTIGKDKTYIYSLDMKFYHMQLLLPAWEFCYQASDATSMTFYPGIHLVEA